MLRLEISVLLIALLSGLVGIAPAQTVREIETARAQLERLEIEPAISSLRAVVTAPERWSGTHLTRAYTLLGIGYAMRAQLQAAQEAFHEALWFDPTLRLDTLSYLSANVGPLFRGERARWTASLRVISDPANVPVYSGKRLLGNTPLERRVPAEESLQLVVHGPGGSRSVTVSVPSNRLAVVEVSVPLDTLLWPRVPSEDKLRSTFLRASLRQWQPPTAAPDPVPSPPSDPNAGPVTTAGALILLGGLATAVVGGITWVGADFESDRERAQAVTAVGVLGMAGSLPIILVGTGFDRRAWNRSKRRHDSYQAALALWETRADQERSRWLQQRVRQALAEADAAVEPERQRIMEHNATVRARNARLPVPQVTIQRRPSR